ncbi:hypothetical protein [Nonomuraea jiangxiensis]|uniref:hypothetical protein n=1 Tax=Nonomuraea jiangxiensis TaxID=633440 RepID=UPI000B829DE2|nr:hypothetical protein [Nonomuraea jiangxiensis]
MTSIIAFVIMAVVLIAGIVVTTMRRRDHGRAAILGMTGCIVLLLGVLFNVLYSFLLPTMSATYGLNPLSLSAIFTMVSVLFQAVGIGLLIGGVVARRNAPQPAQPQGVGWQQPAQNWSHGPQQPTEQWPPHDPQQPAQWPHQTPQQPPAQTAAQQPPLQPQAQQPLAQQPLAQQPAQQPPAQEPPGWQSPAQQPPGWQPRQQSPFGEGQG